MHFVFNFEPINEEVEKEYIYSIIEKLFPEEEKMLHEMTRDAIFEFHKLLREIYDPSVVSLRDVSRFFKYVKIYQKYFAIKYEYFNEQNENNHTNNENKKGNKEKLQYKIKSIICSIYLCYYIKLTDEEKINNFNFQLRNILFKLVNYGEADSNKDDYNKGNLLDQIKSGELKNNLKQNLKGHFSDFLEIEEDYLKDKIELGKGIDKNNLLKDNIFLLFSAVITEIPLIIVGNTASGKSSSIQLIYELMKGIYSKNKFFLKFPPVILTYFEGSEFTVSEDVEKLFERPDNILVFFKIKKKKEKEFPISMNFFDELGIAEKSENNPLNLLNSKLEYASKGKGINFIGISNISLDRAKLNKAFNLYVSDLDRIDPLTDNPKSIDEYISKYLIEQKEEKKIKVDHGISDFYYINSYIENTYERYFRDIYYSVGAYFDLKLKDIEKKIKIKGEILEEFKIKKSTKKKNDKENEKEAIKVSSVFLFRKMLNLVYDIEKLYKISNIRIFKYYLNESIKKTINDINNSYLLGIKSFLVSLIYQNIKKQYSFKLNELYEGSPFYDDYNEYIFKKMKEIKDDAKKSKLIILQALNNIYPYLYDLFNMNYIKEDEKKYVRKIIFDKLINEQMILTRKIKNEINLKYYIEKYKKQVDYINKDLLINFGKKFVFYQIIIILKENIMNKKEIIIYKIILI